MSKGKARTFQYGYPGQIKYADATMWDTIYEASTTINPLYNVGDRIQLPDGRVFRYGKCGATLADMKHGVKNHNLLITELDAIAVAAAVGQNYIDITFADTDGVAGDGVIAADELRGGLISLYRSTDRQQRGIIGNEARAAGDTGNTRVYLDAKLKVAILEDDNVEVIGNPYSDLRIENSLTTSVMGMPSVLATVGQYFWIQTWGMCRVSPTGAELGVNNDERMFMFDAFGSVRASQASIVTQAKSEQIAGFIVERTDSGAGSAAPFINLQINP